MSFVRDSHSAETTLRDLKPTDVEWPFNEETQILVYLNTSFCFHCKKFAKDVAPYLPVTVKITDEKHASHPYPYVPFVVVKKHENVWVYEGATDKRNMLELAHFIEE